MYPRSKGLADKRILFAPHEIGGQMQLMVEELRRRGYFATAACDHQEFRGYINDIQLNSGSKKGRVRQHWAELLFAAWAASNYDIFHFFWGRSLLGFDIAPHPDLPALKRMGKKILVHFRGTDVLNPDLLTCTETSAEVTATTKPDMSRPYQQRSLRSWRKYADRLLVSWPGLLDVVPEAVLVPPAIDVDYWRPGEQNATGRSALRVLHAPTARWKKGTEHVLRAIEGLRSSGVPVELELVEGVPARKVKERYERCDVAIDQLAYGWHGTFSVEMMALGKPVICYIDRRFLRHRPDLPIVSAGPGSLQRCLMDLIGSPARRRELGEAGRAYACKYHDVKVVVDKCLGIYRDVCGVAPGSGR